MNRRQFLSTAALPALLQAQEESGFISLFDGKSLHGWKIKEGSETAFYVDDGAIVVHDSAGFPTWLSSQKQYENFDFRGEFYIKGWMNSGIYIHAPEHGRNIWCGMKINIFQDHEDPPKPESMGSIFPLVPPRKINVKNKGEWNSFRILMDWPRLQVWTNDELVQDLDVESHSGLAAPAATRIYRVRVALLRQPFPQFAHPGTAVEADLADPLRIAGGFRKMEGIGGRTALPGTGRRAARRRRGPH